MDGVILGLPGPWADSNHEAADIYTTKIGGLPDWSLSIESEKQNLLKCSTCGSKLSLLAQIYAPLSSIGIDERVIYVFGCLVSNCESLLWRALRVQKLSSDEVAHVPISSSSSIPSNNWRKNLWSFDIKEEASGENDDDDDDMDMEELARAFSEAANLTSTDKRQNNGAKSNRKPLPTIRPARSVDDKIPGTKLSSVLDFWSTRRIFFGTKSPTLASYEVFSAHSSLIMNIGSKIAIASFLDQDFNHLGFLIPLNTPYIYAQPKNPFSPHAIVEPTMHKYESPVMPCFYVYTQEEKPSRKASSDSSKSPFLSSFKECDNISEDQSNEETYEEEKYEYDRALNADRTYLKFKKRMDAYPQQCFRYSYGGKPLLASAETGDPGMCNLCGAPRHYEMQLMPPLIFFLHEAADDQQKISLDKFDWMTLLVYTCSKSCGDSSWLMKSGDENWIVAEEVIIVQHE